MGQTAAPRYSQVDWGELAAWAGTASVGPGPTLTQFRNESAELPRFRYDPVGVGRGTYEPNASLHLPALPLWFSVLEKADAAEGRQRLQRAGFASKERSRSIRRFSRVMYDRDQS
jgi:hypothetical protein